MLYTWPDLANLNGLRYFISGEAETTECQRDEVTRDGAEIELYK